jgi:hypothetical protein
MANHGPVVHGPNKPSVFIYLSKEQISQMGICKGLDNREQ